MCRNHCDPYIHLYYTETLYIFCIFCTDLTVLWQSPFKVYSTTPTTLIGAVITPLFTRDLLFDWFEVVSGDKKPLDMNGPFISVTPGAYTAKVTFLGESEVQMTGFLSTINVIKCQDLFQGKRCDLFTKIM